MEPLIPDTSFHIFDHANGFGNVFRHEANYYLFQYIFPNVGGSDKGLTVDRNEFNRTKKVNFGKNFDITEIRQHSLDTLDNKNYPEIPILYFWTYLNQSLPKTFRYGYK